MGVACQFTLFLCLAGKVGRTSGPKRGRGREMKGDSGFQRSREILGSAAKRGFGVVETKCGSVEGVENPEAIFWTQKALLQAEGDRVYPFPLRLQFGGPAELSEIPRVLQTQTFTESVHRYLPNIPSFTSPSLQWDVHHFSGLSGLQQSVLTATGSPFT